MKAYYYNNVVSDLHFGPMNLTHTLIVPGKAIIRLERGSCSVVDNQNAILMELHNNIYVDGQTGKLHKGCFEYDLPEDKIDEIVRIAKEYAQVKKRFDGCGSGLLKIIGHENDDAEFAEKLSSRFERQRAEVANAMRAARGPI